LDFIAFVGFIHNESVTMHGHTIVRTTTMDILYTILYRISVCTTVQQCNSTTAQ